MPQTLFGSNGSVMIALVPDNVMTALKVCGGMEGGGVAARAGLPAGFAAAASGCSLFRGTAGFFGEAARGWPSLRDGGSLNRRTISTTGVLRSTSFRNRPVWDLAQAATSSGVPVTTT